MVSGFRPVRVGSYPAFVEVDGSCNFDSLMENLLVAGNGCVLFEMPVLRAVVASGIVA